jgi:hypothetical protein
MTTTTKKFLCLCYYSEAEYKAWTPEQHAAIPDACAPHDKALRASGKCSMNTSLGEQDQARVIRPSKNGPVVSKGAYAPTPEPVGAMFMVEAADMDEAVGIASLHPGAQLSQFFRTGGIEVRQLEHFDGPKGV